MKKTRTFWHSVLFPRMRVLVLLTLPAAIFLLPIDLFDHLFFRSCTLLLSLYVLLTLFLRLPRLYRHGRALLLGRHRRHGRAERWTRLALFGGLLFNLAYALFRMFAGIVTSSFWFCAEAVYYVILSAVRFALVEEDRRMAFEADPQHLTLLVRRSYRRGGRLLLLLALAMCGIVVLALRENRIYVYPNFIIFGAVLFTVWRAGGAIYHLLHFRKKRDPVLLSAKALSLSAALLSLFALQSTLLSRFGQQLSHRVLWNGITGGFACFLLTVMALMMIRESQKHKDTIQ